MADNLETLLGLKNSYIDKIEKVKDLEDKIIDLVPFVISIS